MKLSMGFLSGPPMVLWADTCSPSCETVLGLGVAFHFQTLLFDALLGVYKP